MKLITQSEMANVARPSYEVFILAFYSNILFVIYIIFVQYIIFECLVWPTLNFYFKLQIIFNK